MASMTPSTKNARHPKDGNTSKGPSHIPAPAAKEDCLAPAMQSSGQGGKY